MEFLRAIDETEVAETFLRAELQSPRFRDEIRAGRRGWRIGGLFDGFPDDIEWQRVALRPGEVLDIHYIDWDWWLRISDGTRSPVVAARRIRAGLVPGATAEPRQRAHRQAARVRRSAAGADRGGDTHRADGAR